MEEELRKIIRESGIPQYVIAERAGISPSIVCDFLNGKRSIRLSNAVLICKALNISHLCSEELLEENTRDI
jgi:transcriptional regulator with XRE-family HTH domain